jgi:hypothetical protein
MNLNIEAAPVHEGLKDGRRLTEDIKVQASLLDEAGRVAVALIEALQDVGQRITQVSISQNGKPWFIEMPGRGLVVSSDVKVSYCPPMKSCRWVQVCVCRSANLSDKSGFSYLGTIDVYDQTEFQSLETLVGQVKAKVRASSAGGNG